MEFESFNFNQKKPKEGKEKVAKKREGLIDRVGSLVQGKVNEANLPTKEKLGYKSTVGIYGGKIRYDDEKMIFDMRGVISKIDQKGDAVLRTMDEHTLKNPVEMLKRHPRKLFKFLLAPGTKRYRGNPEEIYENIKRLGLEEEYGIHQWGIEIKDQKIYKEGRALQDIYRSDLIEGEDLNGIDRFEALSDATKYISDIHREKGAIGEVLPSDVIFREKDEGEVSKPVLSIPDIVYNGKKNTSELDKKTTDLLDFTVSICIEELRRSGDWNEVKRAIQTIFDSYENKTVISLVKSFLLRGRLTVLSDTKEEGTSKTNRFLRPVTSVHNKARLGFDKDTIGEIRELIISECDNYLTFLKSK